MITRNSTRTHYVDTHKPARPAFLPTRVRLLDLACWLVVGALFAALAVWALVRVAQTLASLWLP